MRFKEEAYRQIFLNITGLCNLESSMGIFSNRKENPLNEQSERLSLSGSAGEKGFHQSILSLDKGKTQTSDFSFLHFPLS